MLKYYIPVEDGDGHVYLCERQSDAEKLRDLFDLDYDDLAEEGYRFIDSFDQLDGRECYIVLKDDLESE